MFCYSLLALFYTAKYVSHTKFKSHQELPCNNNISFYDVSNKEFLKGFDLRPIQYKEPPIETLIDLQEKRKRMLKLCDQNYSLLDREQWAREYLKENETIGTNLFNAGLLDDWDFEL